jgi:ABC-2 type transport system ATP-binding protein
VAVLFCLIVKPAAVEPAAGLFFEEFEMSEAVYVSEVSKQFGRPNPALWRRASRLSGKANARMNGYGPAQVAMAVDRVSFIVNQGEIFGILGPYGSGKSTLIQLLATQLLPDSGELRVFGYDVVRQPLQVQRMINRVSVEASFFKQLSPMENLLYGARLQGMSGSEARSQVTSMLARLGFDRGAMNRPMEEMPRGLQQKAAIARALLFAPRLLLLDEPTSGLDPGSKGDVHDIIRELRQEKGTTILFTTQDPLEAQSLCDRVAVIESGRIVALNSPFALKRSSLANSYETRLEELHMSLVECDLVCEGMSCE